MSTAASDAGAVFSNGRTLLLVILFTCLAGVTVLGILHDVSSDVIATIYTTVIAGAIGHANGNLQGRLSADREHLIADAAKQGVNLTQTHA